MSSYSFIVDNLRFSYSTLSGFEGCPYSFKLSKIDMVPRINNFYGEYGSLVHECMEKFFKGELEMFELSNYFNDGFDKMKTSLPTEQKYLEERYRKEGDSFFSFFLFKKEDYDILSVEDDVEYEFHGSPFIAKADLVLRNKATKENILLDYKTSAPWKVDKRTGKEKVDKAKLDGYEKQMYTYTYALRTQRNIPIDKVALWFPRMDRFHTFEVKPEKEIEIMEWLKGNIDNIRKEEEFPPNNSNSYFCNVLCGVRESCEYRHG
jgi:hypothetical protein